MEGSKGLMSTYRLPVHVFGAVGVRTKLKEHLNDLELLGEVQRCRSIPILGMWVTPCIEKVFDDAWFRPSTARCVKRGVSVLLWMRGFGVRHSHCPTGEGQSPKQLARRSDGWPTLFTAFRSQILMRASTPSSWFPWSSPWTASECGGSKARCSGVLPV